MPTPKHLHIVSFNVPWPADYGGVIDVYHRIVALHRLGVNVHLHCYTYGRAKADILESICCEVCYYQREVGFRNQLERRPYIVASRSSKQLIARLKQDDYPILLEGLHNGYVLEQLADGRRKIMVRAHNVEHDYYHALAQAESWGWKRFFFWMEAIKLKRYEPILLKASRVLAISDKDAAHFRQLGCSDVTTLLPSHGHVEVSSKPGKGDYVLYHGNLSVVENIQAVRYIATHLIDHLSYNFVVAGRNPDASVVEMLKGNTRVRLIANPDDDEMHELIANAQVNLLVTQQATGVKLKLMNALYEGRFCLVNPTMVEGTGLASACIVAETAEQMQMELDRLMQLSFDSKEIEKRKEILSTTDVGEVINHII